MSATVGKAGNGGITKMRPLAKRVEKRTLLYPIDRRIERNDMPHRQGCRTRTVLLDVPKGHQPAHAMSDQVECRRRELGMTGVHDPLQQRYVVEKDALKGLLPDILVRVVLVVAKKDDALGRGRRPVRVAVARPRATHRGR